jgi:hypothetical protein
VLPDKLGVCRWWSQRVSLRKEIEAATGGGVRRRRAMSKFRGKLLVLILT